MRTFQFLFALLIVLLWNCTNPKSPEVPKIMTVTGYIEAENLGVTLSHEHAMVDFAGAEKVPQPQYKHEAALDTLLPYFAEIKALGVQSMFECTPDFIGRDIRLLASLSKQTGLNIITNTGYYAAADKKFLPAHTYTETAEQLAERWIDEWNHGIDGTEIKPGFIKLGVGREALDETEQKIVSAGAITHLATGLKIAIHTGGGQAAFDEVEILQKYGVDPKALIVVHAQNTSSEDQISLATKGAWVSLDGINESEESITRYLEFLKKLKKENLLRRVLISQDAYWDVIKKEDGDITFKRMGSPYTAIMIQMKNTLRQSGFTDDEVQMLYETNPAEAFSIGVCRL